MSLFTCCSSASSNNLSSCACSIFTLWQIELVACYKQLIGYTLQGILHQKLVFSCSQNYANRSSYRLADILLS